MKRSMKWIVPGICAFGLASCATTDTSSSYRSDAAAGASTKFVTDDVYVAAVEQMASRSGVKVHWVNPPTKRINNE